MLTCLKSERKWWIVIIKNKTITVAKSAPAKATLQSKMLFVHSSVCLSAKTLNSFKSSSFIIHPSSFIIHPSSSFIILHSSYIILHSFLLHFATFKLFSLFRKHCSTNKSTIPHRTNMYTNANYYALKVENKIIIQVSLKQNHKKSSGREKTYHQIQCRGPLV